MDEVVIEGLEVNLRTLPEYMRGGVARYLQDGILSGSFLRAVLENDFVNAVLYADEENRKALVTWAYFLWNELPAEAWGSPEKVCRWRKFREKAARS